MYKKCKCARKVSIQGKVKESKRKYEKENKEGGGISSIITMKINTWKSKYMSKVNIQWK